MKIHTATLIAGILFFTVGATLFYFSNTTDKVFALGPNLLTGGLFTIIVSLLAKTKA